MLRGTVGTIGSSAFCGAHRTRRSPHSSAAPRCGPSARYARARAHTRTLTRTRAHADRLVGAGGRDARRHGCRGADRVARRELAVPVSARLVRADCTMNVLYVRMTPACAHTHVRVRARCAGTCFYVLGLVSGTEQGRELLDAAGCARAPPRRCHLVTARKRTRADPRAAHCVETVVMVR